MCNSLSVHNLDDNSGLGSLIQIDYFEFQFNNIMRLQLLLASGLILMTSGCKEPAPIQSPSSPVELEKAVLAIPERPSEIEVLDLTDDIELYVVIAGAYSSAAGAQKKADELRKAGFLNADVIQRPGSKLHSALVERFDSEVSARAFADDIATNKEIKSYVYKLDE